MADRLAVPLRSRRRARGLALQKLQHAVPSVGLLYAGVQTLSAGAHGFELALAVVEIVTSGLLIATIGRSLRFLGKSASHHAHGVDWIDVCAAGVLCAEAAEKWRLRHHIAGPTILLAAVTLGLGLMHGRLAASSERRRSLSLTDEALVIGGRRRFQRAFKARWSDISSIELTARDARIHTHRGQRRLNLTDLENAAAVRQLLEEAQRRLIATRPAAS